jgi:hypothetical protein
MAREIKALNPSGPLATEPAPSKPAAIDDFKDRLVKLIPTEIVTAYVTIQGLIAGSAVDPASDGSTQNTLLLIVVVLLFLMTPVYLYYVTNVRKWAQIIFASIAFLIWVMVIGGPIKEIGHISVQFIGSILLIIYTLFIPLIYKG